MALNPSPLTHVEADDFRSAMSRICTPVSVVTTAVGGRPHGSTVSAFASLAVDPPSVLISLARTSMLLACIRKSGCFGLNVLEASQDDLARHFATKGEDKFAQVPYTSEHGVPRLEGVSVWAACTVSREFSAADHVILIGIAQQVDTRNSVPLLYHQRHFSQPGSLPGAPVPQAAGFR